MLLRADESVEAAGVVGTGSPASCTEAALRAALAGGGSVSFDCGAAPHTIVLADSIRFTDGTTTSIDGGGRIALSGGGKVGVLRIRTFPSAPISVTIANLTITGGFAESGGGIFNGDTLHVIGCRIVGNTAQQGGGIDNNAFATATIEHSLIAFNAATLALDREAGTVGGGIIHFGSALTISDSTVAYNVAEAWPGLRLSGGDSLIVNSTIHGNVAFGSFGGAIAADNADVRLVHSTVSGNGGPAGSAAGVDLRNADLRASNSIVAANRGGSDCRVDTSSLVVGAGTNLDGDGTCAAHDAHFTTVAPAALALDALADRGGATPTQALLPGSPAIDAADDGICAAAPVLGKRGVARPLDGDGADGAHCDVGAFEAAGGETPAAVGARTPVRCFAAADAKTDAQGTRQPKLAAVTLDVNDKFGSKRATVGKITILCRGTGLTRPGSTARRPDEPRLLREQGRQGRTEARAADADGHRHVPERRLPAEEAHALLHTLVGRRRRPAEHAPPRVLQDRQGQGHAEIRAGARDARRRRRREDRRREGAVGSVHRRRSRHDVRRRERRLRMLSDQGRHDLAQAAEDGAAHADARERALRGHGRGHALRHDQSRDAALRRGRRPVTRSTALDYRARVGFKGMV
jgi:hypothetical protein